MNTRSRRALFHMLITLAIGICFAVLIALWQSELFQRIYLADQMTYILNGFILLLFFMGIFQLSKGFRHYDFEEKQLAGFIQNRKNGITKKDLFVNLSQRSIIANRYQTIKKLFDRRVPINHSAISAIMVAEESQLQSLPKFINSVLILTGVFGTIISLIFALVGASAILKTAQPGEGMGLMLGGMNTALTTTATAIVCFFFFTYFYQRFTDVQTHVFSQIEKAVLMHIIPEFAFDKEAINYRTTQLIGELQGLVAELKSGAGFIEDSLAAMNDHNVTHIGRLDAMLARQDSQIEKAENVIACLDNVQAVLKNGFRLKE